MLLAFIFRKYYGVHKRFTLSQWDRFDFTGANTWWDGYGERGGGFGRARFFFFNPPSPQKENNNKKKNALEHFFFNFFLLFYLLSISYFY